MPAKTTDRWKLILASQSPRRRDLLGRLGVPFEVRVVDAEEISAASDPAVYAVEIARVKGNNVRALYPSEKHVVVSADTVVALNGKIFGKPRSPQQAREFLLELSGQEHQVYTGVVMQIGLDGEWNVHEHVEKTTVRFAQIPPWLLERYVASGDPLDKAGAYGIQGDALAFVKKIDGCYANVMGFPLEKFNELMGGVMKKINSTECWQSFFLTCV
jgi:septum formation protein